MNHGKSYSTAVDSTTALLLPYKVADRLYPAIAAHLHHSTESWVIPSFRYLGKDNPWELTAFHMGAYKVQKEIHRSNAV